MIDEDVIKLRLKAALANHLQQEFRVENLKLLTGGSAAQTWRFCLVQGTESA